MKTILIIVMLSLSNPTEPSMLAHKSYPTMAACEAEASKLQQSLPEDTSVKTMMYCIKASDLTE